MCVGVWICVLLFIPLIIDLLLYVPSAGVFLTRSGE